MPTVEQLSSLFKALARKDLPSAEREALAIVADEANKGHASAAQLLRGALASNGAHGINAAPSSPPQNGVASFLTAALSLQTAVADLSDVVLPSQTRLAIEGLIEEYRHQEAFRAQGLRRRSKVIFHGPPGCGKTMAAKALANALGLPAYVVRFDAVVGSYLGQTAANLRQLFQFAEARQAVVVFDEVDALGKRRGSPSDVGELDRIVIALMQELELSVIQGVIVATSNLASSLDEALWRRFDLVVKFPAPSRNALQRFAKAKAKAYGVPTAALARGGLGGAKSFADAERAVEDLARRRLLGALRK